MKYNLATDLISTELIPWADEYEPSEPITEYWPPALWSDVAQTRAEYESGVITDPTSQVDIKYIYSRKYRPYALFTQHWNTMDPKIVHGVNGYAIHAKVGVGTITEIIAKYTEVTSLAVNVSANITSVSADSITATNVSSTIEIVHQLSGVNINKYRNGEFQNIHTTNITATGTAQLTAYRAYWADIAEMYQADDVYEYGTLVEFSGTNEISLATSNANGCISKSPAFRLNSGVRNDTSLPIVLVGKTKVKVTGAVNKFDRLELSDIPGIARTHSSRKIIGIALESNPSEAIKLVESIVKLTL